jgi:hypothetical protein
MFTKKFLFGFVVIAVFLIVFSGTPLANDDDQRSCDPAGLWFGLPQGSDAYKVVSFIPLDGGQKRYILVAEDKDPGVTPFRGEMVRIKKNHYKLWGMMYSFLVPGDYLISTGEWYMTDCNTAVGNYLISYYLEDPFHDNTAIPQWSFPIVNTYERMPMIDDSSGF